VIDLCFGFSEEKENLALNADVGTQDYDQGLRDEVFVHAS